MKSFKDFNNLRSILLGLTVLAFLSLGILTAGAEDSADQARSYCVKSGYLYSSMPGVNGGQGICVFPDNRWCDSQAFFQGTCGRNLNPNILPVYASEAEPMWTQSSESICQGKGGFLRSVHTPYGDITICAFPDGSTCDMKSMAEGRCGGDPWLTYARSWLDAP
jgi:putative hemolysin